jgi:uncharacterized protein YecT (DUF1311 family)
MTARRHALIAAMFLAISSSAVLAQPSFDCAKASTAVEKAICATPDLAEADAALAQAYAALAKTLPPAQQAALRANQRGWLTDRDGGCFDQKDAVLVQCLRAAIDKRRRFLVGEGANGPTSAPPLLPAFFYEAKKKAYEIIIAYPQFAAAPRFNAAAHDAVFGQDALSEYRQNGPNRFNGSSNYYQASYDITYLDPRLAAVTLDFSAYSGGAHPTSWRIALLWSPATDQPVALDDFLADPAKAVPAISTLCKTIAEKEDWGLFDDPDFDAVVKDAKSWSVDKDRVTLLFDAYSVAPYVAGPHECRLTYAELKDWLKPDGPLPPK